MTLPTFVGVGTSASAGSGVPVTPGLPASIAPGDVLILHIEGPGEDRDVDRPPDGWTYIDSNASSQVSASGAQTRHSVYWHLYSESIDLEVPSAGTHTLAVITAWRGCRPSYPVGEHATSTNVALNTSHSISSGTISTTFADSLVVITTSLSDDGLSAITFANSSLSSVTTRSQVSTTQDGGRTLAVASGGKAVAGNITATTWTTSVAVRRASVLIALVPITAVTIPDRDFSTVVIEYDGDDITDDVMYPRVQLTSRAMGYAGDGVIPVKDIRGGPYVPGYFQVGKEVTVDVDGQRVWGGYVMGVERQYAFSVEDTTDPIIPRFWLLHLADYNVLFSKHVTYNIASPTKLIPHYDAGEVDWFVVDEINTVYTELDDLGVTGLITPNELEGFRLEDEFAVAAPGTTWGDTLRGLTNLSRRIFYISPSKHFVYADVEDVSAPFGINDRPASQSGTVGGRSFSVLFDASAMANDALVWGAGVGTNHMVFARVEDADSIATHGRFQWADFRSDMFLQASVDRRADSYVYGARESRRGHKDDRKVWNATVFRPGLEAGMVVDMHSFVYGVQENVPIRELRITFPTHTNIQVDLELSHELDPPWGIPDWPFYGIPEYPPQPQIWTDTFIIPPLGPGIIPGSSEPYPFNTDGPSATWNEYTILAGDDIPLTIQGPREAFEALSAVDQTGYWVYNIVTWPSTDCGVGPGGWGPKRRWQSEWYPIFYTLGGSELNADQPAYALGRDLYVPFASFKTRGTCGGLRAYLSTTAPVASAAFGAQGDLIGEWDFTGDIVGDPTAYQGAPGRFYGRYEEFGGFTIPYARLTEGQPSGRPDNQGSMKIWIGMVPNWEVQAGFACDISYYDPTAQTIFVGPVATGEWGSGSTEAAPTMPMTWLGSPPLGTGPVQFPGMVQEPLPETFNAVWQTGFPYTPGSLEVYLDGIAMRRNTDFWEVDPSTGEFKLSVPYDARLGGSITVKYFRLNDYPNDVVPMAYATGSELPGGVEGGRVYRPRFISQLGWGSELDGVNCVAAAGCVLLDRHTMGQKTATPPQMRSATGDSSGGLTQEQLQAAILNQYGEQTYLPGNVSFAQFQQMIRAGRGCLLSGNSSLLVPWDLHARSEYTGQPFVGPHSVFINEERSDGYFFVYDPAFRPQSKYGISPGWYPPAAIRAYASGRTGSTDSFYGLFSRKTPLI